jgi:hypothetical protein
MGGLTDEWPYPYVCAVSQNQDKFLNTLSEVNVLVDGELCGQLPSETEDYVEYTVTCPIPISGSEIKLETTRGDHYLALSSITGNEYHEYNRTLQEQIEDLELRETSLLQDISDLD